MSSTFRKGGNDGNGENGGFLGGRVVMRSGWAVISCGISRNGGNGGIAGDEWCAMVGVRAAIWAGNGGNDGLWCE